MEQHGVLYGIGLLALLLTIAAGAADAGPEFVTVFFLLAAFTLLYGFAVHYQQASLKKGVVIALCIDLLFLIALVVLRL
jgi:hypothetical protein